MKKILKSSVSSKYNDRLSRIYRNIGLVGNINYKLSFRYSRKKKKKQLVPSELFI
jgi:hypothetical protein